MSIIDLIKNKNIKELKNKLLEDPNININIRDNNYNYFIYYVLLYNQEDILDLILKKHIRLDILDSDGRNILYVPIKFSYNSVLEKLLNYDSSNIGISILDIKDKIGLTALHYSIIFNNYDAFKLLLKNNADILMTNNQELNAFHIAIQYNRMNFFIDLLNNVVDLNFYTIDTENLIQFCIVNDSYDFIQYILKKKININTQESLNGLTALHQIITKNNKGVTIMLLTFGAKVDIADFYGNTSLHYAVTENNLEIIRIIMKYEINYNLTNIDGDTPLHLYLLQSNQDSDIVRKLILHTDLNIQNNQGITCLKRLIDVFIFDEYRDILREKELNFYIGDISESLKDEHIFNVAVDSYYNSLIKNNLNLVEDWEKWCSKSVIDKLKTLKINKTDPKDICKEKIREVIRKEKRTLPKYNNMNLVLDNGIFMNNCYYTGIPLDILSGLLYLFNTFKKRIGLVLDYPLTVNNELENYYRKIGIDFPFKMEFSNCEILWSFQKIFYPSYFDYELQKKLKDDNINFIVIPIGIELQNGSHANILIIDKKGKTVERFEPNGANYPLGLNYNPTLLDSLLENKFVDYNLVLIKPQNFLPTIGFQILENLEESKCKRLGDPNGFCGVWCTWWAYHRIKNPNISNKELAVSLIQIIKMENKSFKNLIRNFSYYIVEVRDNLLKKFHVDINDWMVNNMKDDTINLLEKEILNNII